MATQLVDIASGQLSATISPLGAELHTLRDADGRDLQWSGDPAVWSGRAPILFPVIGLLNDGHYRLDGRSYSMPKHGFARRSTFDVIARQDSRATFRLKASPASCALYPFEFRLDITFSIVGASLSVSAIIVNLGQSSMPASLGFHPAFRWPLPYGARREDHRLTFPQAEPAPIRRIDAEGFLVAEPFPSPVKQDTLVLEDDLFVADAIIFDALRSRSVQYGAELGPCIKVEFADFPTLGTWTKPGAAFICIEPWHGFSDPERFHGDIWQKPGIFAVAPDAQRTMEMVITLVSGNDAAK